MKFQNRIYSPDALKSTLIVRNQNQILIIPRNCKMYIKRINIILCILFITFTYLSSFSFQFITFILLIYNFFSETVGTAVLNEISYT